MKKSLIIAMVLVVAASFAACGGGSKPGGKVLVTVGSEKITAGDLDLLASINPRLKAQLASEFGRKKILDNLVEQELLFQASTKEGLQNEPSVKDKIEIYRRVIISQAYIDKKLDEAAKKYYDENKAEFEKMKMSQILISIGDGKKDKVKRSDKEALDLANKIKARIDSGEKFEVVAEEVSDDSATKKQGGDLGFVSKNEARLTRRGYGPLLEKAFTMKVAEVSGPIKTKEGYHIIIVTQGNELQPFEEVKQGILFKIRATARNDIISDLQKKYKVKYAGEKPKEDKKVEKKELKDKVKKELKKAKKDIKKETKKAKKNIKKEAKKLMKEIKKEKK